MSKIAWSYVRFQTQTLFSNSRNRAKIYIGNMNMKREKYKEKVRMKI